jgi:hypothetical protein
LNFIAIVSPVLSLEHLTYQLDKLLYNEALRSSLYQTLLADESNRIYARQSRTSLSVHITGLYDPLMRFTHKIMSLCPLNQRYHACILGDFDDLWHCSVKLFLRSTNFVEFR